MESWERARRKSISNRELLIAIIRNKFEEVDRLLLNEDVDINFKDADGHSALSLAAEAADTEIVRLLLEKGAVLDIKNNNHETPLDISKRLNRLDIVEIFEAALDNTPKSLGVAHDSKDQLERNRYSIQNDVWNNSVYNSIYQLKALLLFLYRGLAWKYSFRLDIDETAGQTLKNLIFTYTTDHKKKRYRIFLIRHTIDEMETITADKLLSGMSVDYSLLEYFRSYQIYKRDILNDGMIEDVTVCTNVNFDFDSLKKSNIHLRKIEEIKDVIASVTSTTKLPCRYKFTESVAATLTAIIKNDQKSNAIRREVDDFLQHLIFAVEQANEEELSSIIKKEIGKEFACITTEIIHDRLFIRIRDYCEKVKRTFASCSEGEDLFEDLKRNMPLWHNMHDPIKAFVGRREQLENVHRSLQDGDNNAIIRVSGLSGVGKSELVRKYIAEHTEYYDHNVVWINAESYHTLVNCFHKLASDKLGIGIMNVDGKEKDIDSLISEVYQHFSKSKSLFVFDDYKARDCCDYSSIDRFLPRLPDNCHKPRVIVTSRNGTRWPNDNAKLIILRSFEEREAVEFVEKNLKSLRSDDETEQAILELGEKLQLLPLALRLAIAHIAAQHSKSQATSSSFRIRDYTKILAKLPRDLDDSDSGYSKIIQTTLGITLEAINHEGNCNDCLKILNVVSYFLPDNIPVKTLQIILSDRDKLSSAIAVLKKYSLLDVYRGVVSVHSSIQQANRLKLIGNNEEKRTLEEMLRSIESARIDSRNVDHFISIWSHCKRYSDLVETYHYVFSLMTGELTSCGRIEEAHAMGIEIVELLDPLSNNSNVQSGLMNMKSRLGDILLRQGKYEAALREFEELYEAEIGLKGSSDSKALDTKSDIALALQKLGKTNEALRCYQEILEIRRVTLGESHTQTLSIKSHMATVLMEQEKYAEALPIFEQVYNAQRARLGDNHYDTLMTRNSMAALFLFQRRHEDALKIFQDIYNARDDTLFENHPALLVARQNIATTLQRQKKYDLALEIYEEVHAIQRQLLGDDHPEVLAIRGEIALMNHMLGRPNDALTILREVLERQSEVLGLYHPLVLRTQFFVAHNLEEQCRYAEALPIYQELLKLGISATGVASMPLKLHASIGSILMLQGNVDKALKHYAEVLRITESTRGSEHPQSLIAKSNVGSLYYKKKEYDKALNILTEVHDVEERVFGKDHESYNSTHHFIQKIVFEKQLHETQKRASSDDPLIAIENGDLALLRRLVKRGSASIHERDASKKTLLHHATRANRTDIVRFLLSKGADVTAVSDKGKTALHVAVLQNVHADIVDELLQRNDDRSLIDARTTMTGSTALHVAARNGFYEMTRLLLTRAATYDARNNDGKRPVDLAKKNSSVVTLLNEIDMTFQQARLGQLDCCHRLKQCSRLEYLAATSARDCHGYNLMQVAIANNQRQLVESLGQLASTRRACISSSSFNANLDEVLSLAASALTRLRDYETCTTKVALKRARKLVATLRAQDKRALDRDILAIEDILALTKSRKEDESLMDIARIAVDVHVKMFVVSMYSVKLLDAAKRNDWSSVEKCVSELADVNVRDEGGWTPLLHAANAGNARMVKLLLDNGARVNCATNTGKNTSLHIAVNKGHLAIAKLLLQRDATSEFINAKTEAKGSTALHVAAKIGCLQTVLLLLKNGAVYCLPNKDGELPIDLTSDEMVREFLEFIDELFYEAKNGRAQIVRKLKTLERDRFAAVCAATNHEEFSLANYAANLGHGELASAIVALYE